MSRDSRIPRGVEWSDITETLHTLLNVVTVRGQYPAGHPAIGRADEVAALSFTKLLTRMPELVVALIDGEFVVCERPLPDLRNRIGGLAEAMTKHDIECIVFQPGITRAECATLGEALASAADSTNPARAREQAQTNLSHILLRFAELRSVDDVQGNAGGADQVLPNVRDMFEDLARTLATGAPFDREGIRAVARHIILRCSARGFTLSQRCYVEGEADHAGHAANVALATATMALDAGYADTTCIEVTAAALLHDVGHMLLPREIQGIPEPLLDERGKAVFRQHPFAGARALFALGAPPLWVAAALEHHRGIDGGGYPALGTKDPPHELVRLVSLASFFDRRRTLMRGQFDEPEEALRRAAALEGRYFDRATLRRFCRALGVYPPGTTVQLSDEEAAIVSRVNPSDPIRPEVTLLSGPNAGKRVDLKAMNGIERRHEVSIVRATFAPILVRAEVKGAKSMAPSPAVEVQEPLPPSRSFEAPPPTTGSFAPPAVPRASSIPAPRISEAPPSLRAGHVDVRAEGATDSDVLPPPPRVAFTVPPKSSPARIDPRVAIMEEAAAEGELAEALFLAEAILASDPSSSVARTCAERCRAALRLPPPSQGPKPLVESLEAVLVVAMSPAELKSVPLDPRAGFVLSLIDGVSSLETVLDLCGMPEDELFRMVNDLARRGVVKAG